MADKRGSGVDAATEQKLDDIKNYLLNGLTEQMESKFKGLTERVNELLGLHIQRIDGALEENNKKHSS